LHTSQHSMLSTIRVCVMKCQYTPQHALEQQRLRARASYQMSSFQQPSVQSAHASPAAASVTSETSTGTANRPTARVTNNSNYTNTYWTMSALQLIMTAVLACRYTIIKLTYVLISFYFIHFSDICNI